MSSIGDNIRTARKALQMSQDDLAEAIGANRVTISKYENNAYLPSIPALERLAIALKTTPAQLTGTQTVSSDPWNPDDMDYAERDDETVSILFRGIYKMPREDRDKLLRVAQTFFPKDFNSKGEKR